MKKDTVVIIFLIIVSIPFGIILSMIPDGNTIVSMGQRMGHCLIFTGIFTLVSSVSILIRKKKHPQTYNELFSLDQEMILFYPWRIIKENNKLIIKMDRTSQYFVSLVFGVIGVATTYVILPRVINFEPSFMFSTPGLLIGLMILIDICAILIMIIIIIVVIRYDIIKIIDADDKILKFINRDRFLTIPISNLNQLNVWRNEISGYFDLLIPLTGNSGDLSIIKNSLSNDQVILIRDKKNEEILREIMTSIRDFFEKFPI